MLGALLADGSLIWRVDRLVAPASFYLDSHQAIYKACVDLAADNTEIDLVTVTDALRRADKLETAGGVAYISGLADELPDVANVEHYARIVAEHAARRLVIDTARQMAQAAVRGAEKAAVIAEHAVDTLLGLPAPDDGHAPELVGSILKRHLEDAEARRKDGREVVEGIRTGLASLDAVLHPMAAGQLIIMAAATGIGKTSLALQIAGHASVSQGKRVLFLSLEMSKTDVAHRAAAQLSRVPSGVIQRASFSREDWGSMATTTDLLLDRPFRVADYADLTLAKINNLVRREQRAAGLDMLIVDYLQLISPPGRSSESRAAEVAQFSRGLKRLSGVHGIPVLALAQLNRGYDHRRGGEDDEGEGRIVLPQLSDLRESGAIEQDADAVIFLARRMSTEGPVGRDAKLLLAKQRGGRAGVVISLVWAPDIQLLEEAA